MGEKKFTKETVDKVMEIVVEDVDLEKIEKAVLYDVVNGFFCEDGEYWRW